MTRDKADFIVIGGGFYGCGLALFLRSTGARVVLLEQGERLLDRASRANQARVHGGFHYPRSVLTAVKSMALQARFAADFPEAVRGDFQMLYAIARHRSKVSARQFWRMFAAMQAPIAPAGSQHAALFDAERIEAVFTCREYAFDFTALRAVAERQLHASGVDVRMGAEATRLAVCDDLVTVELASGDAVSAPFAFNVTYARINEMLSRAGMKPVPLKFELAELALFEPPPALAGLGVTVMDGPFFSMMPYPARGLYSLTHVRHTPRASWTRATDRRDPDRRLAQAPADSRQRAMLLDAVRMVPALAEARYRESMYEVKCLLQRSEQDDARPILFHQAGAEGRLVSIMGGKIDNIYDLFAAVSRLVPGCQQAHAGLLVPGRRAG